MPPNLFTSCPASPPPQPEGGGAESPPPPSTPPRPSRPPSARRCSSPPTRKRTPPAASASNAIASATPCTTRCSTAVPCWTRALPTRSEEHTSELQSRSDLVCRLLLEKKKKQATRVRSLTNSITHSYLL